MIKTILLFLYNIIRIFFLKCFYGRRIQIHWMQRISPLCSLKVFDKGTLHIGRNTEFAPYCDFQVHGNGVLTIGDGVYLNRYCMISAHNSVSIGDGCFFGPGVRIFDNNHKFTAESGVSSELNTAPITIGNHCWIASNVIILKGAKIGNNCVIGAGCIVSGEIPDGTLLKCKQETEKISIR